MKIRQGDTVLVITGKDKGKTGQVERVLAGEGKIVVAGINMRTKHIKKTPQQAGRKIRFEATMNMSKVMLLDPKSGKPTRAGFQLKNGKKVRIARLSGAEITKAKSKVAKQSNTKDAAKTTDAKKKPEASDVAADAKQPFWKRMKFGSAAMDQAEVPEQSGMEKDHSIPSQEIHVRKGARGS